MPCTQRVAPQQRSRVRAASARESAFNAGWGSRGSVTGAAPHAQAAHAAVRENAQPQMRSRQASEQLASEKVSSIRREFALRQERLPSAALEQIRRARAGRVDHFDRAAIRKVPFEMIGVDFEDAGRATRAE